MSPRLAPADVARMRLLAQGLVDPLDSVAAAVRHLACAQGQDYPGSTVSVALRTRERSVVAVRAAYDAGTIVRSWPMRGTLFVVPAEDVGWITALTAEKTRRAAARRSEELGLTAGVLDRAEEVARDALTGGGTTREQLLHRWREAGVATEDGRGYHHLSHLALAGVVVLGPTEGTAQRVVLADEWITAPRRPERDAAVRELLTRYVSARGPVALDDFCWWSKLGKVEARAALDDVAEGLLAADVEGRTLWLAPDLPDRYAARRRATASPLLLPGFDEMVLGYGDRTPILTPEEERLVVPGRNGVFKGTLVHRGRAVATWKRSTRRNEPVQVQPFDALPASVASALPCLTDRLPA